MEVVEKKTEDEKLLHEEDFDPGVRADNGNGEVNYGSGLLEQEMIRAKNEEGEHLVKALVGNVGVMEKRDEEDPAQCTSILSKYIKNKKKKQMDEIYNNTLVVKPTAKEGGKQSRTYEGCQRGLGFNQYHAEFSILDDDIEFRNSIIYKEAVAIWKVSFVLGVVFDRDKDQMIEVFQRLEEDKRKERAKQF
ncbi:hypothetical protein DITRI_Ditri01bG0169500 [Diplodiscus trichospermus]